MKVGIDLGTTNSALAFIDVSEAGETAFPPIHILEIPQMVAEGVSGTQRTLPSFLYLGNTEVTGVWAREQGALVPTRLVHSAKSWLSNPEVDRTAKILPWDSQETGRVLSPVEVSARLLAHLREAWQQTRQTALEEQEIVLTVPASFDEEARELTVEAAQQAGLPRVTLLEEPAAAFYAWIANHLSASRQHLFDGQTVLVCDVGGGTSDFTLIRVSRQGDEVSFTRTSVGRHLLLGGDNLDLALAWVVESKIGKPLSIRQRSALRRQCSAAKERLLANSNLTSAEITLLGAGTGLVGGTLRTELTRDEALAVSLEGFLPFCALADKPKEDRKSLFRELGLPYVADPAITRHLAMFLESAGSEAGSGPDAILFNGGFFQPDVLRQRVAEVVERWYGRRPLVFENRDLDLAVAVGAAYYSYARGAGAGVMVRGGLPRTYFIGIGDTGDGEEVAKPSGAAAGAVRAVCLVPRGTEAGTTLELDRENLQLVANRPVMFRLYSSLTRTGDNLGDVVEFPAEMLASDDLHEHAPLRAVIRFGKRAGERLVPVKLGAHLTEIGTLEIWCDSKVSDNRWRLEFQLRKTAPGVVSGSGAAQAGTDSRPVTVVSEPAQARAVELIRDTFRRSPAATVRPEELPGQLEQALGLGKNSWPLPLIRRLADVLLELTPERGLSPAHEARWLNLCGFALRPGLGYPGDELRIEQARRVWASGLVFANQMQCQIDWWIFWGRVAGGLNRNQQVDLYQRVAGSLLPRGKKRPRLNNALLREMWRAAASLELLPLQTKADLGDELARMIKSGEGRESELWCLGRIGARELLYGPVNQVVPPARAGRWLDVALSHPQGAETAALIARQTGDATRDLPPAQFDMVRRAMEKHPHASRLLPLLEGEELAEGRTRDRIFGEELPSGLVFAGE
jgi:hypothetical protein